MAKESEFLQGYNQALSDNKDKLFSEKEALELAFDAFVAGRRLLKRVSDEDDFKSMFLTLLTDKNIQSLTKQEWNCELETEEVLFTNALNSEDILKSEGLHDISFLKPKITNNSVKVIKIIK